MINRNLSAGYIAIYVATCAYGGSTRPTLGMDNGVVDGNVTARACIFACRTDSGTGIGGLHAAIRIQRDILDVDIAAFLRYVAVSCAVAASDTRIVVSALHGQLAVLVIFRASLNGDTGIGGKQDGGFTAFDFVAGRQYSA